MTKYIIDLDKVNDKWEWSLYLKFPESDQLLKKGTCSTRQEACTQIMKYMKIFKEF